MVNYLQYPTSTKPCVNLKTGLIEYCHPETFPPAMDVYYKNNGDGTFSQATSEVRLDSVPSVRGLGIGFGDFNANGFTDIYVANDTDPNF